ncbi:hypothetical protein C8Q78DRAFT_528325 [Trametes maxima]|nr:hypothetical protein C8Q78DRAFT_528325 [Trametes maxima]
MSVQLVLPLNWLFDEFDAIVQRSRDGQRGTVVLYKCKKCEVPVFEHKYRARRHATLQRHRRYFPTDISDTGALSESDAKIHSPRRSSSAPPSSPRRPTSSHSRTPGHLAPLSGVHRANRDTFTGGRSAEDPVYHAGLDSESDTSESEVFNVGLGHGHDTFDAVHDSLPKDLPWSDEDTPLPLIHAAQRRPNRSWGQTPTRRRIPAKRHPTQHPALVQRASNASAVVARRTLT